MVSWRENKIMTKPLPQILDELEEATRLANLAADRADIAAREAREAGELAGQEARKAAEDAVAGVRVEALSAIGEARDSLCKAFDALRAQANRIAYDVETLFIMGEKEVHARNEVIKARNEERPRQRMVDEDAHV